MRSQDLGGLALAMGRAWDVVFARQGDLREISGFRGSGARIFVDFLGFLWISKDFCGLHQILVDFI